MKTINRRGFLKSLAALSGTAMLPMPLLADDSVLTNARGGKIEEQDWSG